MRPINFIDIEKEEKTNNIFNILLLAIPFLIIIFILFIDYNIILKDSNNVEALGYSENEILKIKNDIEKLENDKEKLSMTLEKLDHLDNRNEQIILTNILNTSIDRNSEKNFVTKINYNNDETTIEGNSIDTKSPEDDLIYFNSKFNENLYIYEMNFSDGFYTYILKEGVEK